jgi:hypothetical protein
MIIAKSEYTQESAMANLPFPSQSSGSSGDVSYIGSGAENAGINGHQGDAPGGRWPQDDLPVASAPGNSMGWTEGFSPSPENPPLPGSPTDGVGLPPAGNRR